MGFGLALGCPEGHSALLQLQESEVRLLEGLRKWMGQRAKSDREYAALLHQMHSLAGKQEGGRQPRLGGQIGQVGSPGRDLALPRPNATQKPCWLDP
uniref:FCH domain-containing protein n=1 Tax=Naja naja TaxID=35670 RepID=A0A8C6YFG5_NAJNA